jgi:hypothetical protein
MEARKGGKKHGGEGTSVRIGWRSDNMHSPCLQNIFARTLRLTNESDTPTSSHPVQEFYTRQKEYNDLGSLRAYVPSATIPRSCILHTFQRVLIVFNLGRGFQGAVSPGAFHSSVFIVLLPSKVSSLLSPSASPTLV